VIDAMARAVSQCLGKAFRMELLTAGEIIETFTGITI
jgi:hypothetical protein